ncbi:MAG: hypothetical protein IT163_11060 [Bryobacterales bacterium]|nr:hypothetical protein [Bryobacterales bacterium]
MTLPPPSLIDAALDAAASDAALGASRVLFHDWVEPLGDAFTAEGVQTYVHGFAPIIARALPGCDAGFLIDRYRRIRSPRPFDLGTAGVTDVVVLSRVTLGADVAVSSVLIDAARRAFPHASLYFAGNAKNAELFLGEPRLRHIAVPYTRTGALYHRLEASAALATLLPPGALVLDPDSRLSQLGLIPVCDDARYLFFESRTAGASTAATLPQLAVQWCRDILGADARPWTAPLSGIGGPPRVCVSLGTGENPDKGLGHEFEAELVRRLAATGQPLLIDKGAGGEEGDRVEAAIAAATAASAHTAHPVRPGQIQTWLGPFSPFAFEIARAPLYAGYDSAGQHVAAAAGTPLLCLFAGAPCDRFFDRWRPSGNGTCLIARHSHGGDWRAALDALGLAE